MISVEKTSRILNHFNVSFSEGAVLGYIQKGSLEKAPLIQNSYHSRNTKFNYGVNEESLARFLQERVGATEKEINDILYG
ncbi:hypothetical protein [Bacillus sp. RS11]|uniref:hypothetical protein n=1 Tax=Lysinibacillus sp. RS11 TaxID=3242682 RepID=UPI0035C6E0E6